jgi:hypothetical protein
MDTLYCLSRLEYNEEEAEDEYHDFGVYYTFDSALISIYDLALHKFKEIEDMMGKQKSFDYLDDLEKLKSMREDYKPDKITYLFDRRFRITRVKNMLTNKIGITNIIKHIDERFEKLTRLSSGKGVCFPITPISTRIKDDWFRLDQFNAAVVINYLEKHIQGKIENIKVLNDNVVKGILEETTSDFIAVRFVDTQSYILQTKDVFGIVVSPNTGYEKSL